MTPPADPFRTGAALTAAGFALFVLFAVLWGSLPGIAALLCTVGVLLAWPGLTLLALDQRPESPLSFQQAIPQKWRMFGVTVGYWLLVDQATKYGTTLLRVRVDEIPVIPGWLSIVHAQNFGAAFSSLEGQYWLFIVFVAVATVIVFELLRRLPADSPFMAVTLGMMLSGAWGNGLDRLTKGHVTDFIRVYADTPALKSWLIENFGTNTWPIFNVADSVLLVGVTIFLLHYLFLEEDEPVEVDAALDG